MNSIIRRASQTSVGIEGNGHSNSSRISENGNFVVFYTSADNLAGALDSDQQVMVYDISNALLEIASIDSNGNVIASETSFEPSISDTGRYVIFGFNDQDASTGVPGDNDLDMDVVIHDRQTGTNEIISVDRFGQAVDDLVGTFSLQVVEDLSVNPTLVGALFSAVNPDDLTGIQHHPGHNELFLFQKGGPDVSLNLQIMGVGEVNGTSGISCGSECNYDFALGTDLTLIANPGPNHVFMGWMIEFGGCVELAENPCDLILDRNKTVTAVFEQGDLIFANDFD